MAELRSLLIGILLFCLIFTGAGVIISDIYNFYGTPLEGEYNNFFQYVNDTVTTDTTNLGNEIVNKTQGGEGTFPTTDVLTTSTSLFKAIQLPFEAISSTSGILTYIASTLGIPGWVITIFLSMAIILIIFWIASAIRGKDI